MTVNLAYGSGHLPIEVPDDRTTVIEPANIDSLADEQAALLDALQKPIGSQPLIERISPNTKICIAFTDITRATPNDRIIPWLLEHLGGPSDNITPVSYTHLTLPTKA